MSPGSRPLPFTTAWVSTESAFPLVLMTAVIMPLCVLASWNAITIRVRGFMAMLLVMETAMLGVFVALDFVLFYVFWEAMLIPMYLLIGVWGGPNRLYAAIKFFLYTLAGSVLSARLHPRPVLLWGTHVRHSRLKPGHLPCFAANVALPGILRRLRCEGPHVSVSHLAP